MNYIELKINSGLVEGLEILLFQTIKERARGFRKFGELQDYIDLFKYLRLLKGV
ncbi:MAG: hypothetical protein Q9M97_00300 [Candidatus Gracilibacteria bacterium]|nr:hypothetical protein [Candidatus Gracilibacteria bacterium]